MTDTEYGGEPSAYGGTPRGDDEYMYSIIHDSNPAARQAQMIAIAEDVLARLEEKATQYLIFEQTYVLKDQITQAAKAVGQLKGITGEAVSPCFRRLGRHLCRHPAADKPKYRGPTFKSSEKTSLMPSASTWAMS